ncbi:MAG: endopeptidase La [Candidatus Dadabacteria bacterium]|nr:endopeptidase La [Candidatus Dadabacteria bacterium]NIS09778.1 endopeptidase La [Candidatus Dadabacteria bacterium]NIY22546.1 endopeptidase La [Candidatus Dadabacteria bacterium]
MTDLYKPEEDKDVNKTLPLLPLRDVVIFPYMVAPLFVGREKSIRALEEAMKNDKQIVLAAQKDAKTNDPKKEDIYDIGTIGTIVQMLRLPDGTVKVLVEGKTRTQITNYVPSSGFFLVETQDVTAGEKPGAETEALIRTLISSFENYVKLNKKIPSEVLVTVSSIKDPDRLADTIASHLSFKLEDKQEILQVFDPVKRLEKLYEKIQSEAEILQVEKKIRSRVKKQMEKAQKEYYLTEQMKAIQKELGDKDDLKSEINEFEEKLKNKKIPEEVEEKIKKEIKKLKMMSPMSAEATVVRNYVDWLLSVPWEEDVTEDRLDIDEAAKILDQDHYGLDKPKERIIEYLAVRKLTDKLKGPILCFVGPPGVGKTSLAKSIARSMGRKFIRVSLGGVRDEAEIRGHRRTYIGALPGKIIQGMRKAGTRNPVFLLDEIDKLGMDFRGDPASALLEGLDPEQNKTFNDHYLEVDYDLSNVLFITTANILHTIPWALQDRMEIIHIPGYTEQEKLQIAKKFLVPKQREDHGLKPENLTISDSGILSLIRRYTKEAGVRTLEREISTLCRKAAKNVVKKGLDHAVKIAEKNIQTFLGIPKYKFGEIEEDDQIGICTGLAWTELGGEILTVEVSIVPGKGNFTITGKLGEVMQESAQAAMSYVRSKAEQLGLERYFYQKIDIHIHVPEGATPKDGPSAGIALVTAIISALIKKPIDNEVAMTGEITLRGRVLPIGGLKEKILAAHRGRVKKVIIPKDNEKDLKDIPRNTLKDIEVVLVDNIDDVIKEAVVSDLPVFQDILIQPHPAAIPVGQEFGSNVNLS